MVYTTHLWWFFFFKEIVLTPLFQYNIINWCQWSHPFSIYPFFMTTGSHPITQLPSLSLSIARTLDLTATWETVKGYPSSFVNHGSSGLFIWYYMYIYIYNIDYICFVGSSCHVRWLKRTGLLPTPFLDHHFSSKNLPFPTCTTVAYFQTHPAISISVMRFVLVRNISPQRFSSFPNVSLLTPPTKSSCQPTFVPGPGRVHQSTNLLSPKPLLWRPWHLPWTTWPSCVYLVDIHGYPTFQVLMRGGFAKVPFLEAFFWHCNQAVNTTTNNYILYLLLFIYISPLFTIHYSQLVTLVKFHFFDEDITNCELYAANWWIVCESSPIFQGFSIWVQCGFFRVYPLVWRITEPSPNLHRLRFVDARPEVRGVTTSSQQVMFLTAGFTKYSSPIELIPGSKVRRYPIAQCPTEGDLQLRQELVHALQAKRAWNLSSFYWFMLGFPIHWVLEIVRIESPFNKWWLYVSRKALADDNKWPKRNHHNI